MNALSIFSYSYLYSLLCILSDYLFSTYMASLLVFLILFVALYIKSKSSLFLMIHTFS